MVVSHLVLKMCIRDSTIRVPRNAMNWAIFMAGGSFAKIPPIDEVPVYEKASSFSPIDRQTDMDTQWVMGAVGKGYLGYLSLIHIFVQRWLHEITGPLRIFVL